VKHLKQLKELQKNSSNRRLAAEEWNKPWQTLIATSMSARTKDNTTIIIANKLFSRYNTIEKLSKAKLKDIQKIIKQVNYYRTKSINITNCAKMLLKEYKGKVPLNFDKLVELPGVGRKTANVFLAVMGKDAIGVDTHLKYVSNKLGWSDHTYPHKIEMDLQNLFPKNYWGKLNYIVVRFGQTHTNKKKKDEILDKIKTIS
jgi:endonuclease III